MKLFKKTKTVQLRTGKPRGDIPFNRYPRPIMKRSSYFCLNGKWDSGQTVPFPLESVLSEYRHALNGHYSYYRSFALPEGFVQDRVLLHFGAVDQIASVSVNGHDLPVHEGGYLPFSFDITDFLKEGISTQVLRVEVTDTLSHDLPYGKQKKKRGGMWYTPVSGIWQSVWIESVPSDYIKGIRITPSMTGIHYELDGNADNLEITVYTPYISDPGYISHGLYTVASSVPANGSAAFSGRFRNAAAPAATGSVLLKLTGLAPAGEITIPDPKLWSPEEPFIYDIRFKSEDDEVLSYFALREISVADFGGIKRLCLNNRPYFFNGVLDQGYFPEGIYLPNSEEGYIGDILAMKELGFNTLRKHIKIEPQAYYEACDRLGMIVLQDMVNTGRYSFLRDTALPTIGKLHRNDRVAKPDTAQSNFIRNMCETADYLYSFPCICYYTVFNEGWGQFNSDEIYDLLKKKDSTRIIDTTSGWFAGNKSDVESRHIYFKKISPDKAGRPVVVSEFGGYSYRVADHLFNPYKNYGYGSYKTESELNTAIKDLYLNEILPYIDNGLSGCIYTQLSDVEDETNGFLTYDRKHQKVSPDTLKPVFDKIADRYVKLYG